MFAYLFRISGTATLAVAIFAWSVGHAGTSVSAQGYGQPDSNQSGGSDGHHQGIAGDHNAANAQAKMRPPHGGQISVVPPFTFEVVYQPRELRVYVYKTLSQPIAVNNVKGAIAFRLPQAVKPSQVSLQHVPPLRGSKAENYLAAIADWSKVKDGAMKVSFLLENLPQPQPAKALFIQMFALTKIQPQVIVAKLTEADRAGIERQGVCPVTGAKLGGMGDPIKVLIDGQPLYLCCRGCLGKVKKAPEKYLEKVRELNSRHETNSPQKP